MSRIGKQPIKITGDVTVSIDNSNITIKGPKGELAYNFGYEVKVSFDKENVIIEKNSNSKTSQALWGTTRALIQNMVEGVTNGFSKVLELHGVGYKMAVQGKKIVLNLGFSHPIELDIPEGLTAEVEKEKLTISGIDKQSVGQFAAEVRSLRKVEPYKGKGFRYEGEQFIKKEGKKAVGSE
jgi:large subunit ribosomal protein L6